MSACSGGARCRARNGSPARGSTTPSTWWAARRTGTEWPWWRARRRGRRWSSRLASCARAARARAGLRRLGVGPGDRVVAYAPNIPETLIGFIATASLGAIWATCAPEFGARSVIDRFSQIEPKVMLAVGGYGFRDRYVDRRAEVAAVRAGLPTLEQVVWIPYGEAR